MDIEKKLGDFLSEISSSSPTPGGGSVSAFCGAMATSLGIMVCNLTIGKKKYENVQNEISEIKTSLEDHYNKFLELYDLDSAAFDKVMEAYKLPKETEEEKRKRSEEIEKANVEATNIPIEVIRSAYSILNQLTRLSEIGNQNSLSDTGVALLLLKTCAQGAFLNVLINTKALNEKDRARNLILTAAEMLNTIESEIDSTLKKINLKLEQ